jgi:hypothetical protein
MTDTYRGSHLVGLLDWDIEWRPGSQPGVSSMLLTAIEN